MGGILEMQNKIKEIKKKEIILEEAKETLGKTLETKNEIDNIKIEKDHLRTKLENRVENELQANERKISLINQQRNLVLQTKQKMEKLLSIREQEKSLQKEKEEYNEKLKIQMKKKEEAEIALRKKQEEEKEKRKLSKNKNKKKKKDEDDDDDDEDEDLVMLEKDENKVKQDKKEKEEKEHKEVNNSLLDKMSQIEKLEEKSINHQQLIREHQAMIKKLVNTMLLLKQLKETRSHIKNIKGRNKILEKITQIKGSIEEMKDIINNTKKMLDQKKLKIMFKMVTRLFMRI